jgi:hypothetical protein
MKGKNFSCNNATGKRKKSDLYETPYSLTRQLLEREKLSGSLLEPACGNGAIVKVVLEKYQNIWNYDLSQGIEGDFFNEKSQFDTIITNPPFSRAFEFILKAKEIAKQKIVLLLPLSYLHGVKRYEEIYQDKVFPLKCIYVFTRYPMLGDELREDGCYRTGMMVYAWFVWEKAYLGDPMIKWINNQKFVLSKKDKR